MNQRTQYLPIDVDNDISETLESLRRKIVAWQKRFGVHARIETDAGYNNVIVRVTPTKYPGPQCAGCGSLWRPNEHGRCSCCGHALTREEVKRRERQAIHDRVVKSRGEGI